MKKLGSIITMLIIVLTILSSCSDSAAAPKASVTVTLNTGESSDSSSAAASRTLLPSEIPGITTYSITLSEVDKNDGTIVSDGYSQNGKFSSDTTTFTFPSVRIGTYTVIVEGLGESDTPIANGSSSENFNVTTDGKNTITVDLALIADGEYKGAVSMTFDWADLAESNETIQNAMSEGGLVFILYSYDAETKEWNEVKRSEKTGDTATRYEFVVDGLPVSTGTRLKYALATSTGVMLNPTLTTTTAQIYSGLTSVQKGNDNYIYYISDGEISDATNVYDVTYTYGTNENLGSSVIFTWSNQMENGTSLFDYVTVSWTSVQGASGSAKVEDVSGSTSSYEITGMAQGDKYTVTFQAHHKSGLKSPVWTYTEKEVMAEVLVAAPTNVVASANGIAINLTWNAANNADSYTIYRSVDNGEYTKLKENITKTSYSDSDVYTGKSYSYKVTTIIGETESDFSEATASIDIMDGVLVINPPTLGDVFEITFTEEPDVLVITTEQPTLTFAIAPVDDATNYAWVINGIDVSSGADKTFITIDETMGRSDLTNALNTLVLEITVNGKTYCSEEIKFAIGDDVVDNGITINLTDTRLSSESSAGVARTLKLSDHVTFSGGANVIKSATYSVTGGNTDLATVDEETGVITFYNPTDETTDFSVTITATSFGGNTADIIFDVYKPTVESTISFIDIINRAISTIITKANSKLYGDWYGGTGLWSSKTITVDNVSVTTSNYNEGQAKQDNGYIVFPSNYTTTTSIGEISISGTLYTYAENEGGAGALGTDPLKIIGNGSNDTDDILTIGLPYNQGSVNIKYSGIDIYSKTRSGSYTVNYNKKIGYNGELYRQQSPVSDADNASSIKRITVSYSV